MSNWLTHSLRLLKHEIKRGELTIVVLAIVLSVSSVFTLFGFSGQIKQSLLSSSAKFIAADRVLSSAREVEINFLEQADELKLTTVEQVETQSMIFAGDDMLLASLRATEQGYPLRGELMIEVVPDKGSIVASAPKKGEVWIDQTINRKLNIKVNDALDIGMASFTVAGIITDLPDASFNVFGSAPVVILNKIDLPATQLVKPGSRITYKYLFAGEENNLLLFDQWVEENINDTQRWQSITTGNSPLAGALKRAEQYLSLGSMLGIVLSAIAVAVASRRYSQRHQSTVAIFKAIGASQSYVTKLYCLHWLFLSFFSITVGLIIGLIMTSLALSAASSIFELTITNNFLYPTLVAVITGITCAIAFAISPLKALINTRPLSLLRGYKDKTKNTIITNLIALVAVFALLVLFSQNLALSSALLVGGIIVSVILLLCAQFLMTLGRKAGSQAGKAWHLALANLKRRASDNAIQLISFTLAIKLLLLILVMKNSLIAEWQEQLPDNSANRFLVNITQPQKDELINFINANNIVASDFYSIVRGRLTAINQEKVTNKVSKHEEKEADQGRQGANRELNLTWRKVLPDSNEIVAGQWWPENTSTQQVSIAESIAERLEINVDDELTFLIGNQTFNVKVTSIRKVDWKRMQPNFFVIFHPEVLADFPSTYIGSLRVEPKHELLMQNFLASYPTISVIDVDAMINHLQEAIAKVSIAIEFILILVVLAGCLVLIAQVQASMEERERELAILKTLGAKGRILKLSIFYEFLSLGVIAGFMASIAMEVAVYFLQTNVFEMTPSFHFSYWLIGMISGGLFVGIIGLFSCWRLLNLSSVTLIRRTM